MSDWVAQLKPPSPDVAVVIAAADKLGAPWDEEGSWLLPGASVVGD